MCLLAKQEWERHLPGPIAYGIGDRTKSKWGSSEKCGVLDLQSGPYIVGESATWLWACLLKTVLLILLPGSHSFHKGTFFPDEKQIVSVEREI